MSRTALIVGVSGQDGSLLAERLLAEGTVVHGTSRDPAANPFENLGRLGIRDRVRVHGCRPEDSAAVRRLLDAVRPDEVYNLSAQSSVGQSFAAPRETIDSILGATVGLLDAIRETGAPIRFCNAGSGECFGETGPEGADETTPVRPHSPYAVAKAAAQWTVATYRESYGLFAVTAILFNHESPLRPERFVTQKIVRGAARIAAGETAGPLRLGNLDVTRDWGWAAEHVDAMRLMLRAERPEDLVVATGRAATLREFAAAAFAAFGLDWERHVVSTPEHMRPSDIAVSVGRPARARETLGWVAATRMPELVGRLAEALRPPAPAGA
ncbi:GDP-mannose 4,6-dehydratase [Rhodoplanes sp. TEM]|uniref:GDP-mannose 4,6-dehydratase n=1 Tax=Rhodoplanes tepidamans TaxID=200616 RepID=A0ABT5JB78_RHOTP|nr:MULTISPECIES: GDP-mannose 4,6-dehydratase [Rhodoplanes]MDC7786902.1 GDP-mannose 4,6-dehydratase [Rhodoplanes tepidamans]MDC7985368.1 GDP-mannose 4,6-dehydratase [Rhodoplanes sp. TEM]MDQ0355402.1 GDPmannose 4,6-dehydratase [Rhodoplanes tepidamans]